MVRLLLQVAPNRCAIVAAMAVSLIAACAPTNTNTTYSSYEIGRTANIAYGQILSMRPVTVQSPNSGVGTLGGAAVGGTAGSFIGGNNVRGNILGAVGGAIVGGIAGTLIENQVSTGTAFEFVVREDNGQTIAVVQTNELGFQPGERVVLTRGARTRIARP